MRARELDEDSRKPDILVMHYEDIPGELFGDFFNAIKAPDLRARAFAFSSGPYAGLELYLPAAIGIFIASSYFSGFFAKAGEDHYEAFKAASVKLWNRVRNVPTVAIGTPGKVRSSQKFSLVYSITGELLPRLSFKFVLRTSFSDNESAVAISRFLDLIRNIHLGEIDEDTLKALLLHRPIGGVVIVTFDPTTNSIVPVDPAD